MATSSNNIMQMGSDSTIREYVENFSTDEMTHDKFHFQQVFEDKYGKKMLINDRSLFLRYMSEFISARKKYTFTDLEYMKYRFNPKRLSFDLYGTTELWSVILSLNELTSTTQFDLKTLYVFPPYIVDRVQRMINLERETKNYNADEISAALIE